LTYAPESFKEFYNQRRRWLPSTMANLIDILANFRSTIKKNDNVSYPYMVYQFIMFGSTVLGPGTILLMIAGSYNSVLGSDMWDSHILAIGPIAYFVLVCLTTHPDTQVVVAQILSSLYVVIMMIVMVAMVVNSFEESILSPNVLFFVSLSGFYTLAALLHPQEFSNIVHGLIYFLCIPAGFLLLPIYSLCNLNVVSWGTREIPRRKTKEEIEAEKKAEAEKRANKKKKGLFNWLGLDSFFKDLKVFYRSMLVG
jgi:chitin synthase